ncbi:mTERF domain-containing protein 2 [Myotis davidii]|uniref:mTERF domain-containing protein 2 n=1 Tax=Myotis davidii TaxID=225400 RepID=L5M325_MYODS|nr:mTERF domain-containing protein 2 [Myotis davidii]
MLVRSPCPPTCDGWEALAHEAAAQLVARLHLLGDSELRRGHAAHSDWSHGGTRFPSLPLVMGRAEAQDQGGRKWRNEEALLPAQESKRRDRTMAARGRQVLDWHRLIPLSWASISRQTPHFGEQKRATASLLRKLTTASSGGALKGLPHVQPRKYVQELECGTSLTQCLLEKQRAPVDGGSSAREEVISSLLDMGFTDVHVQELLSIQPSPHPQQLLAIISKLILLGVNPEPVCVALKKSPQLLKLPIMHMEKRSSYLRKLGIGEGKLKRMLYCCPEIFTMHQRDIDRIVKYAYFRMGVNHSDMVRTDFLQYSITKIRQRHTFLERLGRYQTPDKKGQTQIPNPLVKDILRVSEAEFLSKTAYSTAEEFEVFKKLLAREEEEESESHMSGDKSTSEEEEEEEEEEEL